MLGVRVRYRVWGGVLIGLVTGVERGGRDGCVRRGGKNNFRYCLVFINVCKRELGKLQIYSSRFLLLLLLLLLLDELAAASAASTLNFTSSGSLGSRGIDESRTTTVVSRRYSVMISAM
jgi:hypothetical protein